MSKLLHEGDIYSFARAIMNYKTHKLNVDYHFLNINIYFKINLNVIYVELHVQIKSLYQKMNLIMSCKNMGIENVVSKQKNN